MSDREPPRPHEPPDTGPSRSRGPIAFSDAARNAIGSDAQRDRLRADEERRRRERRGGLIRAASSMHIPTDEDLRAIVLDDHPLMTDALHACRTVVEWRRGRSRGCIHVLLGPPGVGKTSAACHTLLRSEGGGLYTRASHIVESPRTGHSSRDELWETWRTTPMLVIDELDVEAQHRATLLRLLLDRYDGGRATLVTTNLTRELVVSMYMTGLRGEQLADRLIHAQGRGRADGRHGPGGLPWYTLLDGPSLRDRGEIATLHQRLGVAR